MENPGRTLTGTGLITNVGLETVLGSSGLVMTTFMSWQNLETRSSGWSWSHLTGGQPGLSMTPSGDPPKFQNRPWYINTELRVKTRATVFILAATPELLVTVWVAITPSMVRNSQLTTETMRQKLHRNSKEAGGGGTEAASHVWMACTPLTQMHLMGDPQGMV